ncbi:hypothetical protein COUCH_19390 [Couchioplanes caeruleus]|uniref:hypothetical protein n=1 Tax=Couchioplanes caeruleus TaxID=56438 RepID=UPI0020C13F6C|nr:hypothetical protein [Couchioplanes caeruleus]UQU61234.1 hypothetical protein COUCH_19390 [Couchioplanes caeruleus]
MDSTRLRFDGTIAGIGTRSGVRVVVGTWPRSPFGLVADVMIERPDGHRLLVAPTPELARFVADTYAFDDVRIAPVTVTDAGDRWTAVAAGPLELRFRVGRRGWLGVLLRAVPAPLARRPAWCAAVDLPARLVLPGVRTRGSAGGGRREWYGAQDVHPIVEAAARLDGHDLGPLAPVDPPVRFGFGSTPRRPVLVRVTTTVAGECGRELTATGGTLGA